ncbi:N-acetylmuramoyl-L-alanine amidase [Nocardioides sp.]|uniref:N-acetylmuramoyl-L-alanine amidase n=1 Tax=Nocardioides sp. TaxID=35761 RepID=UPI00286B386D|nr:N-acetylmuramoyl-L-alanine amidase [Nocardioides sp.]
MPPESTPRRPLLKAMAGGVVAVGAVGAAVRLTNGSDEGPGGAGGLLELSGQGAGGVGALDLRLGDDLLPQVGGGRFRSAQLPTTTHSMVAFTWTGPAEPRIQIKSRRGGAWGPWQTAGILHDLPDLGSGEGTDVVGTDLLWIGDSDGIQIHVAGGRPRDLTLVLLHPARESGDGLLGSETNGRTTSPQARATPTVPRPTIVSRRSWGADESMRDGAPRYNETIKQVHVHHTVSTNTYAKEDVAGLIRGMYRYHTQNLGWSDLGYNFLVDRFGRTWEGRAGGAAKAVRGAHTLGFNDTSTGVSVIGNFELVEPGRPIVDAIAAIAAWKLDLYGRKADGFVRVTSEGSDKYSASRVVKLPAIDGHRDTNDTACPGQNLYDVLPTIRRRTQAVIDRYRNAAEPIAVTRPASLSGTPALGERLVLSPGAYTPADATRTFGWARNDVVIQGATGASYTCVAADVGAVISGGLELSSPGREPVTQVLRASGPVTGPSDVTVRTRGGRKGYATIYVQVSPPSGSTAKATGKVRVQVNNRTKTVSLVDGAAVARFGRGRGFKPGRYNVTVIYPGNGIVRGSRVETTITIPPR